MNQLEIRTRMSAILDGAKNENRGLTASERTEFDRLEQQYQTAGIPETRGATPGGDDAVYREAFNNYLRYGEITRELRTNPLSTAPGAPAPGTATAGDGGYFVPQGLWQQLAVALKAYGGLSSQFRQLETPTGNPMPWPTIDPTAIVGTLLSENSQVSEVDFTIGQGMLSAWTVTSGVHLVSIQITEDSAFDIDSFIADRVGESIGRKQAQLAYSGTGSSQPLGINTAIAAGSVHSSNSGGYVALGTATAVKLFSGTTTELAANVLAPQTLVAMISAVDPAYYHTQYGTARFYMNAAQAFNLRQVVDSNGRPILNFANGFTADGVTNPDYNSGSAVASLFGFEVQIDNSIGNLSASTVQGPLFGNLAHAMVQRTVGPGCRVMRLDQRYADYLQVGYVGFIRTEIRSNDLRSVTTVQAQAT